ncbi:DDE-type integrase/transposase/recombinase [Glutamicibacter endophyticus]|uniref:DDE-type integrase/transposase/recombinase n=1 Tax=Glutamicibacter endophyticus TaxID=1522174 RepID=UPI003AF1B9F5
MYVAFVLDAFSLMIVGWQASTRMYTDLALDALRMGLHRRGQQGADLGSVTHRSDRGVQYRAIRYAEALEQTGAVMSKDDSLLTG